MTEGLKLFGASRRVHHRRRSKNVVHQSGTAEVVSNIMLVNNAANLSQETSGRVLQSADHLADQAAGLSRQLNEFLSRIRAA